MLGKASLVREKGQRLTETRSRCDACGSRPRSQGFVSFSLRISRTGCGGVLWTEPLRLMYRMDDTDNVRH